MLEVSFFRSRRFSVAIVAMALVIFALMGGLFLLTQYLQFSLGYTALQTGLRVAPIAAVLLVVAPLSSLLARWFGTTAVVGTGMALIAGGMLLMSRVSVHGAYANILPALFLMGIGAGLAFAPCTDSVMGSVPSTRAGIGAATNGAGIQTGGALGVGLLGSLLNGRYQGHVAAALVHYPVPHSVVQVIEGSLGGALAVSSSVGGKTGAALAALGRSSFVSGMDLAMLVGGIVVIFAAMITMVALPSRPTRPDSKGLPALALASAVSDAG